MIFFIITTQVTEYRLANNDSGVHTLGRLHIDVDVDVDI